MLLRVICETILLFAFQILRYIEIVLYVYFIYHKIVVNITDNIIICTYRLYVILLDIYMM
jgi:hypothetical protein